MKQGEALLPLLLGFMVAVVVAVEGMPTINPHGDFVHTVVYDVTHYGAKGDGVADNTLAIQKAIDTAKISAASSSSSSSSVLSLIAIPKGVFMSGQLNFTQGHGLILWMQHPHSILKAMYNASLYPCIPSVTRDTGLCDYPLVFFFECVGCGIRGPGVWGEVDNLNNASNAQNLVVHINGGLNDPPGQGISRYDPENNFLLPTDWALPLCSPFNCRPKLLVVRDCREFSIVNVTLGNSALWTVTLVESDDILVENSVVVGDRRFPNNDGIDVINSRGVVIRNTSISTGDDCIAIITHTPSIIKDVLVSNCTLSSSSAAIKVSVFDQEAVGAISNLTFTNITITDTNRGLCIDPRVGSSAISNLSFSHMDINTHFFSSSWWGVAEPISLSALSSSQTSQWTGIVENIVFSNIVAVSENSVVLFGNGTMVRNIDLNSVEIFITRESNISTPSHDWRPSEGTSMLYAPTDGIFLDGVQDVSIVNTTVIFVKPVEKYWGQCLNATEAVTDLVVDNFVCVRP